MPKDWIHILAVVPEDVGLDIVKFLKREKNFKENDWCVLTREEDGGRVDFGPYPPLEENS